MPLAVYHWSCAVLLQPSMTNIFRTRNVFAIDSIQHLRCRRGGGGGWGRPTHTDTHTWKVLDVVLNWPCADDDGFFGGLLLLQGTLDTHREGTDAPIYVYTMRYSKRFNEYRRSGGRGFSLSSFLGYSQEGRKKSDRVSLTVTTYPSGRRRVVCVCIQSQQGDGSTRTLT